ACDDDHREPHGKASVFRIGLAPIADTQGDDAAQKQTFVRDWIKIYSESASLVEPTRNVAIQSIAYRSENKNNDRCVALPFERLASFYALAIIDGHRHKRGDHQDPHHGDLIGSGHPGKLRQAFCLRSNKFVNVKRPDCAERYVTLAPFWSREF